MDNLSIYISGFEKVISLSELKPLPSNYCSMGRTHSLFVCPCGGKGHAATMSRDFDTGLSITASPILHCWETGQQWFIEKDVAQIILNEEMKFIKLMDEFESLNLIGKQVTATEAFRLYTERGLPPELLDIDSLVEFDVLMDKHRLKSGGRNA